jgi:hypothetical protein
MKKDPLFYLRRCLALSLFTVILWSVFLFLGYTYAGNPVACAAGLASIKQILERKLPENARKVGAHLVKIEGRRGIDPELAGEPRPEIDHQG